MLTAGCELLTVAVCMLGGDGNVSALMCAAMEMQCGVCVLLEGLTRSNVRTVEAAADVFLVFAVW